jgi:hypothetical protein
MSDFLKAAGCGLRTNDLGTLLVGSPQPAARSKATS